MVTCRAAIWILLLLLAAGCGGRSAGGIRVTGRLVDADTGQPVSRRTFYVHAFHDASGKQVSLAPNPDSTFVLYMNARVIRLRIPDLSNTYKLYEKTFTATGGVLDVEVRLEPTHWITLHGRVLFRDASGALRPLGDGDGLVKHASVGAGPVSFDPDEKGRYSVKAPRELLELHSINTGYVHTPKQLDLRGNTDEAHNLDVILEAP